MTEKRLPQVGEIWWTRGKKKAEIISTEVPGSQHITAQHSCGTLRGHYLDGCWATDKIVHRLDLLHIHTNATGKVINPTFPGDEPMKENEPKVTAKPPKPDPITQALEASRERVKDLEALQELTVAASFVAANMKELAAKIKGLKEKVGMK